MKRTWTIIGVGDVPGSFRWYQALFGQPATLPAHDDFGQIIDADGTVLLCLHEWGAHGHPSLMSPDNGHPATLPPHGRDGGASGLALSVWKSSELRSTSRLASMFPGKALRKRT